MVFEELKRETARRGLAVSVWVTETKCLGVCPREGCALAISHGGGVFEGVTREDASRLLGRIEGKTPR
jgi:(2Fe-2S) ferredoxin